LRSAYQFYYRLFRRCNTSTYFGWRVKLTIPPETQTGKSFRLRGKGVKQVRGGAVGDLLCKVKIENPVQLTKEQKALIEKLGESLSSGGKQHSQQEQLLDDGVKNFFDN